MANAFLILHIRSKCWGIYTEILMSSNLKSLLTHVCVTIIHYYGFNWIRWIWNPAVNCTVTKLTMHQKYWCIDNSCCKETLLSCEWHPHWTELRRIPWKTLLLRHTGAKALQRISAFGWGSRTLLWQKSNQTILIWCILEKRAVYVISVSLKFDSVFSSRQQSIDSE